MYEFEKCKNRLLGLSTCSYKYIPVFQLDRKRGLSSKLSNKDKVDAVSKKLEVCSKYLCGRNYTNSDISSEKNFDIFKLKKLTTITKIPAHLYN